MIGNERFRCPEVLLQPSLIGREASDNVFQTIMKNDIHYHLDLYANVVLSAGATMLTGFAVV